MLEDAAGGCGGRAGDRDGVGLGGEREGVCSADAVSATNGKEQGEAEEYKGAELRCDAIAAGAKDKREDGT